MLERVEAGNIEWFLSLNGTENTPQWLVLMGKFVGNGLILLLLLMLVAMWLWGNSSRRGLLLRAVFVTVGALFASYIIGILYPHARPFVLNIGHTFFYHAPTPSFPSNHTTIFACIGFAFSLGGERLWGALILLLALLVGWSRVFLGVHFPLDILGAFGVSLLVYIITAPVWHVCGSGLLSLFQGIYRALFGPLIRRGLVK